MELSELGAEYLQRADNLIGRIHRLNKSLKTLKGKELVIMKRRIFSLYIDAAECRRQAEHLINYRKGDTKNEQNRI